MTASRIAVFVALAIILGVPFALRPPAVRDAAYDDAVTLIVVTPHVQQIRYEFERGFDRWHHERFGRHARIDWRIPGGTSEIIRQLQAQFTAAAQNRQITFRPTPEGTEIIAPAGVIPVDIALGGGSFDHGRIKQGITHQYLPAGAHDPAEFRLPMSVSAGYSQAELDEWFGDNKIGAQILYDADQYWLGTALSGFGVVFNRELVERLGVGEPDSFEDLADPRYAGWVILADPRQSGSIATAFESVLNSRGWDDGWRILRSMCANSRYYTNSSTKPPIEIGQGEAAAGLAIDFYGRNQAQAVGDERVGYIDPPGEVYIDADPVSIIRGGPNPEIARRFVEFCLTEEGQALWQFPPASQEIGARRASEGIPEDSAPGTRGSALKTQDPPGPERYALRRLPVRRIMYEKYLDRFGDKVNPFELAGTHPPRGWRPALGPMMGAFAIDTAHEQRAAWNALNAEATRSGPDSTRTRQMRDLFFSWPQVEMPDGSRLQFNEANLKPITDAWRKDRAYANRSRIAITRFFRDQYRRVVELQSATTEP